MILHGKKKKEGRRRKGNVMFKSHNQQASHYSLSHYHSISTKSQGEEKTKRKR